MDSQYITHSLTLLHIEQTDACFAFSQLVVCVFPGPLQDSTPHLTLVSLRLPAPPRKSCPPPRLLYPPTAPPSSPLLGYPVASLPLPTVRLTTERLTVTQTRSHARTVANAAHLLTHVRRRAMTTKKRRRPQR